MARAVEEIKQQHLSAVKAAWKGAFTTHKPGERPARAVSNSPAVVGADAEAPGQAVADAPTSADANGADPPGADGTDPANADDAGRAEEAKADSDDQENSKEEAVKAGHDDQEGSEEEEPDGNDECDEIFLHDFHPDFIKTISHNNLKSAMQGSRI